MHYKLSVKEFIERVKSDEIDVEDFYSQLLKEVSTLNKKYNFFITMCRPKPQKESAKNKTIPYLPVSVKDCICTEDIETTAGSKILKGYIPPFDATCVERIKKNGGVIIGKTNQDEFGFGTFSVNSGFDVPKNPIDPTRTCGGSSGGAACITKALDYPHIAIAESTGGSISCPASFCGVVGFTPTYGLVSRYGLIDYSNSLDKIGIIAKTTWDIALVLSIISGYDPKDSTSLNTKQNCIKDLEKVNIEKIKIGVPEEYFENIDSKISDVVWDAIKTIENMGAQYEKISLKYTKYVIPTYYIIATSEASTNLARFCGMRYGAEMELRGNFDEYFSAVRSRYFGEEAKRRIMLGTFSRMAGYKHKYYLKALKVRTLIINDFQRVFKKYDILMAPTMPIVAPKFSEIEKMSPVEQYMMDILTAGPNLAGIPHISIPCGTVNNLPVGLHILGNHLHEEKLLQIASFAEKQIS